MIWFNYPQRSYTKQLLCTLHSTYYIYLCRSTSSLRYRTQYRSNRACDAYCCTGYRHDFNGRCIGMCRKIYLIIIMNRARPKFVRTNHRNWPKNSQRTPTKLLRAVRGVTSTGISISSLRNEGFPTFCLCLNAGRHVGFTETLRNLRSRRFFANSSWGNVVTAFSLLSQFHVCVCEWYKLYSGMHCILGERKWLGGETVGLQYPVWLLRNFDST